MSRCAPSDGATPSWGAPNAPLCWLRSLSLAAPWPGCGDSLSWSTRFLRQPGSRRYSVLKFNRDRDIPSAPEFHRSSAVASFTFTGRVYTHTREPATVEAVASLDATGKVHGRKPSPALEPASERVTA